MNSYAYIEEYKNAARNAGRSGREIVKPNNVYPYNTENTIIRSRNKASEKKVLHSSKPSRTRIEGFTNSLDEYYRLPYQTKDNDTNFQESFQKENPGYSFGDWGYKK